MIISIIFSQLQGAFFGLIEALVATAIAPLNFLLAITGAPLIFS